MASTSSARPAPAGERVVETRPVEAFERLAAPSAGSDLEALDLVECFVGRLAPTPRRIVQGRLEGLAPAEIARDCFPLRSPRSARRAVARELAVVWHDWMTFVRSQP